MTTDVLALVAIAAWLGLLTLVVLLLVRQLGLVTLRLEEAAQAVSIGTQGPTAGTPVPEEALAYLSEARSGLNYVLLLSATCGPCREIASSLANVVTPAPVVALVPGPEPRASELIRMLPSHYIVKRDPEASEIAGSLNIDRTPFVFEIEDGVISGSAWVLRVSDFQRLVDARGYSDAATVVRYTKEAAHAAS